MSKHDVEAARAGLRAEGVARFRMLEREANASLDQTGLTASQRREYEMVRSMARAFAQVFLLEGHDFIRKVLRHFHEADDAKRTGQA